MFRSEEVFNMAADIKGLKYNGQLLGVRIKIENNVFDIDIDVYKKLGWGIRGLQYLDLVEYGDLLVTKEELQSGVYAKDISENQNILEYVKKVGAGIGVKEEVKKPVDKEKEMRTRARKIKDLKGKFYRFVDTKWLTEFVDYHIDNFEGNKNIYSSLNEEQFEAVKKYFRWCSKLLFDSKNKNSVLIAKPKKAGVLVDLMGGARDWYYDGTIDTGFKGGAVCELGHVLRYAHYAYSPSINKHIIFGITCISDFFQIDEEIIRQIILSQEMLIRELKVIIFIMKTGKLSEYIEDQYDDLDDLIPFCKWDNWVEFITSFNALGLPLTYSMVYHVNGLKRGNEKYLKRREINECNRVKKKAVQLGYSEEVTGKVLQLSENFALADSMKRALIKSGGNTEFLTHSFNMFPMLLGIRDKLKELYDKNYLTHSSITKKYYFIDDNGKRLATDKEIKQDVAGLYKDTYLSSDKIWLLSTLIKYTSFSKYKREYYPSYESDFLEGMGKLQLAINWALEDTFLAELEFLKGGDVTENGVADSVVPVVPGVSGIVPLDDKLKAVLETIKRGAEKGIIQKSDFVFNVIDTIEKYKKMSVRQRKFVDDAYNKAIRGK